IVWLRESPRSTYGAARETGAKRARAPFIAFIEDHCDAEPRWAEKILEAFDQPSISIVNYAVKPSNDKSWLARMFTMCEYGRWMVPAISGPVPISACQNAAYRREVLTPHWSTLGQWLDGEARLCRAIQKRGGTVWLAADACIAHESWARLSTGVHANRTMKRVFAAERSRRGNFGWLARSAWAAAMVITPPLH